MGESENRDPRSLLAFRTTRASENALITTDAWKKKLIEETGYKWSHPLVLSALVKFASENFEESFIEFCNGIAGKQDALDEL